MYNIGYRSYYPNGECMYLSVMMRSQVSNLNEEVFLVPNEERKLQLESWLCYFRLHFIYRVLFELNETCHDTGAKWTINAPTDSIR